MPGCKVVAVVMVDRPDERHLVGVLRVERQRSGNVHAGHVGLQCVERAAILGRRLRFWIVRFELAGSSVEPHQDNGFAVSTGVPLGLKAQQIAQRQTQTTEEPGLHRRSARRSLTVSAVSSAGDLQHFENSAMRPLDCGIDSINFFGKVATDS